MPPVARHSNLNTNDCSSTQPRPGKHVNQVSWEMNQMTCLILIIPANNKKNFVDSIKNNNKQNHNRKRILFISIKYDNAYTSNYVMLIFNKLKFNQNYMYGNYSIHAFILCLTSVSNININQAPFKWHYISWARETDIIKCIDYDVKTSTCLYRQIW